MIGIVFPIQVHDSIFIRDNFALKQPYGAIVVNLAVWPFCQNRALPLRGGDSGMPNGAGDDGGRLHEAGGQDEVSQVPCVLDDGGKV